MKVFSRNRCGLRAPKEPWSDAGKIHTVSIHHAGETGAPPVRFKDAAAEWRGYQSFHMNTRGWNDIAYNVGIDALGRLYQGRPWGKLPAAVGNHNSGTGAIMFMQNGGTNKLTYLQRRTFRRLFRYGCRPLGIPPLKNLRVRGHKEFSGHESNACPGFYILRHLRWLREQF